MSQEKKNQVEVGCRNNVHQATILYRVVVVVVAGDRCVGDVRIVCRLTVVWLSPVIIHE